MAITGIVKWFDSAKGFGFINAENEPRDIFVHFSAIERDGFRQLKQGERVEFDLTEAHDRVEAKGVRVVPHA